MPYSSEINNVFKENVKTFDKNDGQLKVSSLNNLFFYFCNQNQFLDIKILNFFFHIVFISSKKSKFCNQNLLKKKKFVANYKISLIFFRFVYFVINFSNDIFQMNSKNFFFSKKNLVQFLLYYKSIYYNIFLIKDYKYFYLFKQFNFKLYYNYLLYSIFYFLKLYIQGLQDLELKETQKKNNHFTSSNLDVKFSQKFYTNNVFTNNISFKNLNSVRSKENIYLRALCSSQMNSKVLDDTKFSILLNNLRSIYRFKNKRKNSLLLLNKLIKRVVPLSKIIYQRRGRSLIPLMTFIYSSDIRNSLGLKHVLRESNKISGFGLNPYENKLLIYLVDILIAKHKNDLIYQFEQDSDIRKEAYNRGYFFKTLKAQSKKNQ